MLVVTVCATVVVAVPAFAANVSEISISGLGASGAGVYKGAFGDTRFAEPEHFGGTFFPRDGNQYVWRDSGGNTLPVSFELRGRGPHGGYITTSAKCSVCHSAHASPVEAPSSSLISAISSINSLTRAGSTGCEYCHLTGSPIDSNAIVYHGGDGVSQTTGLDSGHSLGLGMTVPASTLGTVDMTCTTCHVVHGAAAAMWTPSEFWQGGVTDPLGLGPNAGNFADAGQFENNETVDELGYKMLRTNPSGRQNGAVPESSANLPDNPATSVDQINQYTLGIWCANCHNSAYNPMEDSRALATNGVFDSMTTTFTALDPALVHNQNGGFAEGYDGTVIDDPHSSVFYGVYSGPGQCYTCHRGDLNLAWPTTATWGPNGVIEPIDDADNPDLDELARFRALGYFELEPTSTPASQTADQAHNLACSSCHFGTADYARWASGSDWPHRSPDGDIALLGLIEAGDPPADPAELTNFCARCHVDVSDETQVPNNFVISQHYIEHSQPDTVGGLLGLLQGILSPGTLNTP